MGISYYDRIVKVDSFPMVIMIEIFTAALQLWSCYWKKSDLQETTRHTHIKEDSDQKFILSIDRLDYTKNLPIDSGLMNIFLTTYPEYQEKNWDWSCWPFPRSDCTRNTND
jgi:trehalose 6-phosphate synthase/phosphatase